MKSENKANLTNLSATQLAERRVWHTLEAALYNSELKYDDYTRARLHTLYISKFSSCTHKTSIICKEKLEVEGKYLCCLMFFKFINLVMQATKIVGNRKRAPN